MRQSKVLIQRLSSPDGKIIASAKSVVITSGERESTSQEVTVKISSGNSCSSSSASSFASSN